jgi:hypothetical protein
VVTRARIARLAERALADGLDPDAVQEAALSYLERAWCTLRVTQALFNARVRSRYRNARRDARPDLVTYVGGAVDLERAEDQGRR